MQNFTMLQWEHRSTIVPTHGEKIARSRPHDLAMLSATVPGITYAATGEPSHPGAASAFAGILGRRLGRNLAEERRSVEERPMLGDPALSEAVHAVKIDLDRVASR